MSPVSPITWSSCACLCSQNPANSTHSPTDKSPMEQAHPWPIGERGLYSGCSTSHFLCFSTQVTPLAETHWAEGPFWGGYQLHLHIKSQSKEEILPRRGEGPSQAAGARFPAVLHLLEWNNWPALNTRPRVQSWARGQHCMFTVRYLIRTVSLIAITCPCLQDKRNEYWKPSQKQECLKEVSDSERQEEGEIQTRTGKVWLWFSDVEVISDLGAVLRKERKDSLELLEIQANLSRSLLWDLRLFGASEKGRAGWEIYRKDIWNHKKIQIKVAGSLEGNGNRLQYSCLENLMDAGPW